MFNIIFVQICWFKMEHNQCILRVLLEPVPGLMKHPVILLSNFSLQPSLLLPHSHNGTLLCFQLQDTVLQDYNPDIVASGNQPTIGSKVINLSQQHSCVHYYVNQVKHTHTNTRNARSPTFSFLTPELQQEESKNNSLFVWQALCTSPIFFMFDMLICIEITGYFYYRHNHDNTNIKAK